MKGICGGITQVTNFFPEIFEINGKMVQKCSKKKGKNLFVALSLIVFLSLITFFSLLYFVQAQ